MIRVCFVCLGNICRSPTADGIMRHLVAKANLDHVIEVDSSGTGGWHVGECADSRARSVAKKRGYDLPSRARKFTPRDFARFDFILAMDRSNLRSILAQAHTDEERAKVMLFRDFDPEVNEPADVPDPYYGGPEGFDDVFDMCERTCAALLKHIRTRYAVQGIPGTIEVRDL